MTTYLNNATRLRTPNQDDRTISVDYLVIHYTAVNLREALSIFTDPTSNVSAHLVIDLDGALYELVECLNGKAFRAWHAGKSQWNGIHNFNDCSIGVELVNYNGNLFCFTEAQYQSLEQVVETLKQHYPQLKDPARVVGHEQIAGFRGKADPGICFDWCRFYRNSYPRAIAPARKAVCPPQLQQSLLRLKESEPKSSQDKSDFWRSVSTVTETSIRLIEDAKRSGF